MLLLIIKGLDYFLFVKEFPIDSFLFYDGVVVVYSLSLYILAGVCTLEDCDLDSLIFIDLFDAWVLMEGYTYLKFFCMNCSLLSTAFTIEYRLTFLILFLIFLC